jgi:hypothetical protein
LLPALSKQSSRSGDLAYNRLHIAIRTRGWAASGKEVGMAKLVFGMNQSLDGYVDHLAFAPSPTLFRHFIAQAQAGSVYRRHMGPRLRGGVADPAEMGRVTLVAGSRPQRPAGCG